MTKEIEISIVKRSHDATGRKNQYRAKYIGSPVYAKDPKRENNSSSLVPINVDELAALRLGIDFKMNERTMTYHEVNATKSGKASA